MGLVRADIDFVYSLEVLSEVVGSCPHLGLFRASSVITAILRCAHIVHSPLVSRQIVSGAKPLLSDAARKVTLVWFRMSILVFAFRDEMSAFPHKSDLNVQRVIGRILAYCSSAFVLTFSWQNGQMIPVASTCGVI